MDAQSPSVLPTWQTVIADLFANPYWIDPKRRASVSQQWLGCMDDYGLQLNDYDSVRSSSVLIYEYLYSRAMPLTDDPTELWPDEALETFRRWVNQGWRRTPEDPAAEADRIPLPEPRPVALRVRRDLRALDQAALDDYRMRLEDVFHVADPAPTAPGQIFFAIHGDWCLHYQEAFLLWHRAYLLAFEQRLGCAVPYWNWYAQDAAIDGASGAGLPPAFKDLTYVHPVTGEIRPNPLRFAAAKGGMSKACANGAPAAGQAVDCRWVQRDPILYTEGDDQRPARRLKIGLTLQYQRQVQHALQFTSFSHPQGIGYPWANIQSFDPPPPDADYVYRDYDFDGAYEQPHDNYHGWIGPDMADNAYTAFDPVFWSYHANIDRIFEIWLRANATRAVVTANYPVRPFAGARAERLAFTDPRSFVYTTIGDLAKDSRALGYDFADPVGPDFGAAGPACVGTTQAASDELLVIFDGVRCTLESYAIDVFLNLPMPDQARADPDNPHYAGRVSRIGMGQADDKNRCIVNGVRRMLDATATAVALGLRPGDPAVLTTVVTTLATGAVVREEEWAALPGFAGRLVWARAGWAPRPASSPQAPRTTCCS